MVDFECPLNFVTFVVKYVMENTDPFRQYSPCNYFVCQDQNLSSCSPFP